MSKGNHDYWWSSLKKLKEYLDKNHFDNIEFLHNNSFEHDNCIICGTRGWNFLEEEEDKKILNRELIRLEISIKDGISKYGNDKDIIVCLHYPPTTKTLLENSDFIKLMKKYNVKKCIYGHLHGDGIGEKIEGKIDDIELKLVSADGLGFSLEKIVE